MRWPGKDGYRSAACDDHPLRDPAKKCAHVGGGQCLLLSSRRASRAQNSRDRRDAIIGATSRCTASPRWQSPPLRLACHRRSGKKPNVRCTYRHCEASFSRRSKRKLERLNSKSPRELSRNRHIDRWCLPYLPYRALMVEWMASMAHNTPKLNDQRMRLWSKCMCGYT